MGVVYDPEVIVVSQEELRTMVEILRELTSGLNDEEAGDVTGLGYAASYGPNLYYCPRCLEFQDERHLTNPLTGEVIHVKMRFKHDDTCPQERGKLLLKKLGLL